MPTANGIITAPVGVHDVSVTLGDGSLDVATLCSSPKINKWAKYKPTRYNSIAGGGDYWKGANGNCGLVQPAVWSGASNFIEKIKAGLILPWEHEAPRPFTDWCRIGDFKGYNHYAPCIFGYLPNEVTYFQGSSERFVLGLMYPLTGSDSSSLTMADFDKGNNFADSAKPLSQWYLGVVLYNSSKTVIATSTSTIDGGDWSVDLGTVLDGSAYVGEYSAVPFLCSKPYPIGGSEPSGAKYITIWDESLSATLATKLTVVSKDASYPIQASCRYTDTSTNKLYYKIKIENKTSVPATLYNVALYVAKSPEGGFSTAVKTFGNVNISANGTWQTDGYATTLNAAEYRWFALKHNGIGFRWQAMFSTDIPEA